MATTQKTPATQPRRRTPPVRQTKVVVRRVGAFSIFKISLIFYFGIMMMGWLAMLILYWILGAAGTLTSLGNSIPNIFPGLGNCPAGTTTQTTRTACHFSFNGPWIFTRLFFVGLALVVLWSVVNLLIALLYNLVSDVVGGLKMTLTERQ
jgi:hypothetical protein